MRFFWAQICLLAVFAAAGCTNLPFRSEASPSSEGTAETPTSNMPAKWSWAEMEKRSQELPPQPPDNDETAAAEPPTEDKKKDLWDRLRGEFALTEYSDHPNVLTQLNWYANQTDYLDRVFGRAERYLHFILEEVERRDMPTEIALLPVIESGFYPLALSRRRAAGLWQFIPSTGERFGLKQNWWYDGRRDIYASTRAALDYLEQLHDRFNGDWLLALAAYNAGEGTVERAIRKNQLAGKATDFWNLDLPQETREYVPKLLALSALVNEPEKYGIDLKSIPDSPYLGSVNVKGQLDLSVAAKLAAMPLEDLKRLNPGFTQMAMDPDGPHILLLPADKVETFQNRLAELPKDQRVRWNRHLVQRGETLIRIAQRYGTNVAVLRQINGLSSNAIRAGRYLLIPIGLADKIAQSTAPAKENPKLNQAARKGNSVQTKNKTITRTNRTAILAAAKAATAGLQSTHYIVKSGDSLTKIAARFDVRIADLRKWNTLKGDALKPGQLLTVKLGSIREAQNTY